MRTHIKLAVTEAIILWGYAISKKALYIRDINYQMVRDF